MGSVYVVVGRRSSVMTRRSVAVCPSLLLTVTSLSVPSVRRGGGGPSNLASPRQCCTWRLASGPSEQSRTRPTPYTPSIASRRAELNALSAASLHVVERPIDGQDGWRRVAGCRAPRKSAAFAARTSLLVGVAETAPVGSARCGIGQHICVASRGDMLADGRREDE